MNNTRARNPQPRKLREQAKSKLNQNLKPIDPESSDQKKLLHELQVYQIELEMQNNELMQARNETEGLLQKYFELYDYAPFGYITLSNDGAIIEVNWVAAELLNDARVNLYKRHLASFIAKHCRPAFNKYLRMVFANDSQNSVEFELMRKNEQNRIVQLFSNLDKSSNNTRLSIFDVTERRLLEKESLKRMKQIESLSRRQIASHTASAIAHELNQPLIALASYSQAILLMLEDENPKLDKIRKAAKASGEQALRAGKSIHELIVLLNQEDSHAEDFDIYKEIQLIIDTAKLEHDLPFKTVFKLDKMLPLIRANRTQVHKVLLNLLRNGIESMQNHDESLPVITVTVQIIKDYNLAQITFQDNGPGFNAEQVRRLFEPFFTTKSNGVGMGLVISRSLIEANGGKLWVDPQETPGATFHFTLPLSS